MTKIVPRASPEYYPGSKGFLRPLDLVQFVSYNVKHMAEQRHAQTTQAWPNRTTPHNSHASPHVWMQLQGGHISPCQQPFVKLRLDKTPKPVQNLKKNRGNMSVNKWVVSGQRVIFSVSFGVI